MKSNELYLEAAELKDDIQKIIYHPYLFQHVEPPNIDDEKLLLLCSITDEKNAKLRKETIMSTMLVQVALDIHERILHIDLITKNHKARQLTVLAGDYYSSLYYERLTAVNEQRLIRLLAEGIKEINELKTRFLYGENIELAELMSMQSKIESNIINQFSIATAGKEISNEIRQLLLLKRLIHEKMQEDNGGDSVWAHLFGRHMHKIKSSRKIALLPANIYKKTLQTLESVIVNKYQKLKAELSKNENDIVQTIFNNQSVLVNKMSR